MVFRLAVLLPALAAVVGVRAGEVDRIVDRVAEIRQSSGMASAWLVMVEGERTLVDRGFGIRAWDDPRPVSERDYYRLGSISKAFTGLALLEAADLGCLDLDAPVRTYVDNPPLANRWSASRPVTVAMLMEQTAGWHDMSGFEFKYNEPVSLEEALALSPQSRASRWPPGRHHSYTSSGPGMAARVLEKACGRDFEAFARERVFEPLGMPSAAFTRTAEVERHLVGGYDTDPKKPIRYWHFLYRPAGALNVRPGEMANFLKMLIGRGRLGGEQVFAQEQIERMETPATTLAARAGMKYGYGLGIYSAIEDGRRYFAHGGDADGYLTRFGYSPESERGFFVVITMFDHDPLREMRERLESWVVEPLPRTTPAPHAPATNALEKRADSYRRATIRFPRDGWREDRMQIRVDGDRLEYRTDRRWRLLIPVAPNLFRRPGDPVATAFIGEHDGKVYAQGEFGNWVKDSGG